VDDRKRNNESLKTVNFPELTPQKSVASPSIIVRLKKQL